ncbi:MAG: hypothetical protein J6S14_03110 [Clostridia bacterium]|nr:hypothetical protein [Clostridia bacterium]
MASGIIPIRKSGAALNFRVVGGTTQPLNPKENDIWVETAEEITGYVFDSSEPALPTAGLVWFPIAIRGPVSFPVTEENPVYVYPQLPKQYVSGSWVQKQAHIYQDDAWADFSLIVWQIGENFADKGWDTHWVSVATNSQYATLSTSGYNRTAYSPSIDMTPYSKLVVYARDSNGDSKVGLTTNNPTQTADADISTANLTLHSGTEPERRELNIADINGNYRIAVVLYGWEGRTRSANISRVELQ